ncbi:MAG: hypothetical protein ABIJ61_08575, partial [bacterium]
MPRTIFLATALTVLAVCAVLAAPPVDYLRTQQSKSDRIPDYDSYFDANLVLMMVYNDGNICYDDAGIFCRPDGFYYPYTGNQTVPGDRTCVYAAGLWIGGKVDDEIRVATASWASEFVPGSIIDGQPQPDDPSLRVYKIDASSGPGDPDYDEWPADYGAPVDGGGQPLLSGDQTLWAVFNDLGATGHGVYHTDPLGIEIRQAVWGSAEVGEEIVVYVKYLLYNRGGNDIDSCFISFWADPDLGDAGDDLVGCDTISNIFYCYNDGADSEYGTYTPSWGGKLISGPAVPSEGDTATFDGTLMPDYRNLPMTAFSRMINGLDPTTATQVFSLMKGLDRDGSPVLDNNNQVTTYFYAGDPVTGTGWLDEASADRRFLMTAGPFFFAAGDSQQVVIKLAVDADASPLQAIAKLKHTLDYQAAELAYEPLTVAPTDLVQAGVSNYGRAAGWYWDSNNPRWFAGVDWGGAVFYGSVDNGSEFFGSSITDPSMMHDVEIRFSNTGNTQMAYRYIRSEGYDYGGFHEVPFTVWDIDENRQLNAAFVEMEGSGCFDLTWGPCDADDGGREYLFILNSDYSGTEDPVYVGNLIDLIDAGDWDNLYAWWPRLNPGHTLLELADDQVLGFYSQRINQNGLKNQIRFIANDETSGSSQAIDIYSYSLGSTMLSAYVEGDHFSGGECIFATETDTNSVFVQFLPAGRGLFEGSLI